MREYFTPQRSVFPSYLTVESGRICSMESIDGTVQSEETELEKDFGGAY